MRIGVVYFSGTDVTKIVARSIWDKLKEMNVEAELIDITPLNKRENTFSPMIYDALILGFPVYSDFAPSVINDWISHLRGKGMPCVLFCTYGGRTSGYFHYHTYQLMTKAGFKVLMSAEFLGRHTFNVANWKILPSRPDNDDLLIAQELAEKAWKLFQKDDAPQLKLQKPLGYKEKLAAYLSQEPSVQRKPNQPVRQPDSCSLCGLCQRNCPTGAFNAEKGIADPEKCIMCQRCLFHCPDQVLILHEDMYRSYEAFLKEWGLSEEIMNKKKSKLILHAWDTVQ